MKGKDGVETRRTGKNVREKGGQRNSGGKRPSGSQKPCESWLRRDNKGAVWWERAKHCGCEGGERGKKEKLSQWTAYGR